MEVLPFFEWVDSSPLAEFSKAYGGVFAIVQVFHILSMIVLGGMVLTGDLRLLGIVLKDVPSEAIIESTHRWISRALIVIVLTGCYMTSAIAIKTYHSYFFWAKMSWLLTGLIFVFAIRRPLFRYDHASISPWTVKLVALASITIWFNVAASGRWIGFS